MGSDVPTNTRRWRRMRTSYKIHLHIAEGDRVKYKFYALSSLFLMVCNVGCNQESNTPSDSATAQSTSGRDSSSIEEVKYKTLSDWFRENETKFVSNVQNKTLRFRAIVLKIEVQDSLISVGAAGPEDFDKFVVAFDKQFVDDLAKIEIGQTVELTCTYNSIQSVEDGNGNSERVLVYDGEKITAVKSE